MSNLPNIELSDSMVKGRILPLGERLCRLAGVLVLIATAAAGPAAAAEAEAAEDAVVRAWTEDALAQPRPVVQGVLPAEGLTVLHKSYYVRFNRTGWDTTITLGEEQYAHGVYMDAPAALLVRLAEPAEEFSGLVGIDNNKDTQAAPTISSARFHVVVGGKKVFSSPVRKFRDGALPVRVKLDGAREFVLETDDGGDGRSHDQCVWADAQVKFADGSSRYVGAIPMDPARRNQSNAPVSFLYDGKPSDSLLSDWQYDRTSTPGKDGLAEVITYQDPRTGLVIEVHVVRYDAFPAVEWVCRLSNTGSSETPIIDDFLPLNSAILTGDVPDGEALLRWSNGDGCTESSFLPHDEPLERGSLRQFAATSSNKTCLPFFNLKGPDGGWILAVGWTGRWRAEFLHEPAGPVVVRAGMQSTHFRLKPGEKVRTPRIVMLRYTGDRMIDGHNAFRRLMLAHYVPREGAAPAIPPVATNNVAGLWLRKARTKKPLGLLNEAGELALIPRAAAMGCEAYWMDAYWFPQPWYKGNIGNWYPREDDFPRGLRPLADAAHQHGLKMILWFAPLHVNPNTQWANDYPQFIHESGSRRGYLWKLGDPEARETLVRWLSERHREWGFDVYREDFGTGIPPEEGPERMGIAEMKHIEGFYWFWSELKRRNPGLLIDNCSGGGRRIDIETARLAYCLWRSDFNDVGQGMKDQAHWPMMGRANQVMVTGLSLYYPLHTGPVWDMRPYNFRSAMSPGIVIYTDLESEEFSTDSARKGIAELKQLRPYFLGDIYPLLPLTTSQQDWYAYQLDRGDLGEGCVLVFRRPESPDAVQKVRLERIDPNAEYSVSITGETYELAPATKISGSALEEVEVRIDAQPGSTLIRYKRL